MADTTCRDCLFRDTNDYCHKREKYVDWEKSACSQFLSDKHLCCYDCRYLDVDTGGFFGALRDNYCEACRRKIKEPGNYFCNNFRCS